MTDAEKLRAIEAAIRDYYLALDERQHGGVAQSRAFGRIEDIMGLHWSQWAETRRREAEAAHSTMSK